MADTAALPQPEARKKPSKPLIGRLLRRQRGTCASCPKVLAKIQGERVFICAPFDVDHIRPLDQLGDNSEGNLQCLCVPCHSEKTKADIRIIAKGRRVRKSGDLHADRMNRKAKHTREVRKILRREEAKIISRNDLAHPRGFGSGGKGRGFVKHPTLKRSISGKVVPR